MTERDSSRIREPNPMALWPAAEPGEAPPDGDVEVWYVDLGAPPAAAAGSASLSDEELTRAARFRLPRMRRRYLLGRTALREALGRALGVDARLVPVSERADGKPFVPHHPSLWFNIAHSGNLLLIAVSRAGEVGVDIERLRALPAREGLIRRVCTAEEQAVLNRATDAVRTDLFFRAWTRKEAVLKATGRGLRVRPAWIGVTLENSTRCSWSYVGPGEPPAAAPRSLRGLIPAPGCAAALAVREPGPVRCRWWSP